MDTLGTIEIKIDSKDKKISHENYDLKEMIFVLGNMEKLLHSNNQKQKPLITYKLKEGSVKHLFTTTIPVITIFLNEILIPTQTGRIESLPNQQVQIIENFQNKASEKGYNIEITSSVNDKKLRITPDSKFLRPDNIWVDAELYFYGILKEAGGKSKTNIHLDTEEFGYVTIDIDQEFLENQKENLLYKRIGIRATGKQNIKNGEIDKKKLVFKEFLEFSSEYDENYLNSLIKNATPKWKEIKDPDRWLNEIRGNDG